MVDMQVVNEFIQDELLEGTDKVLRDKCVEVDKVLRTAVEDLNKLREAINNKNTEIARLNGILEGYLIIIQDIRQKEDASTE